MPGITQEQFREAALAAVRTVRQEATHRERGHEHNPVVDVSTERAAETLATWVAQSHGPLTCRFERVYLTSHPFESDGVRCAEGYLDLSSGQPGAIVWCVVPMILGRKHHTMLIGAVRLYGEGWTLIRRAAAIRHKEVVFEHDERWYDTRRKRTLEVSPATGQLRRRR